MLYDLEYYVPLVMSGLFMLLNLRDIIRLTTLNAEYSLLFQRGPHILLCAIASAFVAFIYYKVKKGK